MPTRRARDLAVVAQQLDALAAGIRDLSPAFDDLGAWFADRQRAAFATGGRGKWRELDRDTIRQRAGGGTAPLIDSGALQAAATSATPVKQAQSFVVFGLSGTEAQAFKARLQVSRRKSAAYRRDPVPNALAQDRREVAEIVARHLAKEYRGGA